MPGWCCSAVIIAVVCAGYIVWQGVQAARRGVDLSELAETETWDRALGWGGEDKR